MRLASQAAKIRPTIASGISRSIPRSPPNRRRTVRGGRPRKLGGEPVKLLTAKLSNSEQEHVLKQTRLGYVHKRFPETVAAFNAFVDSAIDRLL